jgi:carbonic anhydrase
VAEIEKIRQANRTFAERFDVGDLDMPPARKLAILTCMDARLDPARFCGLAPGDAHVIRNAGGRASDDAVRSLIISSRLLGTDEFVVIHHTGCGMLTFADDDLRTKLREETGADASHLEFLSFSDLDRSVREDVDRIRGDRFLPEDVIVSGHVYDVRTGELREVVPAG